MDRTDRKILDSLQRQGRMTNKELAGVCDLAPSSMLDRVRRLEEREVIKGYSAVLDPKKLGYEVQAVLMINLDRHQAGPIDVFEERIRAIPEVTACHHLTGRYDYMVQIAARDIDHLGELVKHTLGGIAGLEKQETFLVLSTVKEDEGYAVNSVAEKA